MARYVIGRLKPAARISPRFRGELMRGAREELEHTGDWKTAMIIASHHIAKCKTYYKRLARLEKRCRHD